MNLLFHIQVDIFCLAICLYELLTLKGLPPEDFSEHEYRSKLASGWRPLFHSKVSNGATVSKKSNDNLFLP